MKNIKLKLLFSMVLITIILSFSALAVEKPTIASNEVINVIKILEIANGDENGNMNFSNTVTRSEFIKMAVSASTDKDKAKNATVTFSMFPDVKRDYWGAGYISVAIEGNLVNGYLDGTFKPNNEVTLEEAVTIVLRLLGYTSQDFTGSYPTSQLEKYRELELNENLTAEKGEKLTREECMILLYNALCTKNKNGVVYCTTLGYAADKDGKTDYNALVEKKLDGPFIMSEDVNLSSVINFTVNSNTQFHMNNAPAKSTDILKNDVIYFSDKINAVFAFRKTATGIISSFTNGDTVILSNNKSYKVDTNTAKSKLSIGGKFNEKNSFVTLILGLNDAVVDVVNGDVSKIQENSDNATYVSMIETTISKPVYLSNSDSANNWKKSVPFDTANASIYINGALATDYYPCVYDVIYYSKPLNSIWVYRVTKAGTVQSISSSSIMIGNTVYSIVSDSAAIKASTYGEFKTDSYVTLILGKNDEVIDILGNGNSYGINDDTIEATVSLPIYIKDTTVLNSIDSHIPIDFSTAKIYLNGTSVDSYEFKVLDVVYYSKPHRSIWIFRDTISGIIVNVNSPLIIIGNKTYTLATTEAKNKVSNYGPYAVDDYVTAILGRGDEVIDIIDANIDDIGKNENDSSYSDVVSSSLKGPYIITSEGHADKLTFDIENAKIFYLNKEITATEIKPYDVYYFSTVLNTVWIYRDTVSGTIEEITPKASPLTVVMSGRSYSIESSQAAYDLSSFGSFGIGDKATFLLGMDGKVAGVVSIDKVSKIFYGIVTAKGSKTFTEKDGDAYTADYVTVTDFSCNTLTYEFSNRGLGIGDIVRVAVSDSVKISKQSTSFGRNNLASVINAINNKKFADDCKIVEIYGSTVKKVYPSRFDNITLDLDAFLYSSTVLHYKLDNNNNLSELVLNNFTGDLCEYGIVTSANATQITYMTDNTKKTFIVSGISCSEGAAIINTSNGTVSSIKNLTGYVEDIDFITDTTLFDTSDYEYPIAEDVKVFVHSNGAYKYISIDEAISGNYSYEAYYDKHPSKGGRIRVIIATKIH